MSEIVKWDWNTMRMSLAQQVLKQGPGHHPTTARVEWNNRMECFYKCGRNTY